MTATNVTRRAREIHRAAYAAYKGSCVKWGDLAPIQVSVYLALARRELRREKRIAREAAAAICVECWFRSKMPNRTKRARPEAPERAAKRAVKKILRKLRRPR